MKHITILTVFVLPAAVLCYDIFKMDDSGMMSGDETFSDNLFDREDYFDGTAHEDKRKFIPSNRNMNGMQKTTHVKRILFSSDEDESDKPASVDKHFTSKRTRKLKPTTTAAEPTRLKTSATTTTTVKVLKKQRRKISRQNYKGQFFRQKYLSVGAPSSYKDLKLYIDTINRSLSYISKFSSEVSMNIAVGIYIIKFTVKRTIMENRKKLTTEEMATIKGIYKMADLILLRFLYVYKNQVWSSPEGQVITIYFRDISEVFMLGKFSRGRLHQWIYSKYRLHDFVPELDNASLTRAKYAEVLVALDSYYLSVNESDICFASIPNSPEPWDLRLPLTRCRRHTMCDTALLQAPSIGYSLAHRALNLILRRLDRRCYIMSEARDLELIDVLCANMYREVVYIARRGYFARDMFMEHIVICSMMGYEEFHRAAWYRKVASFVDNIGCVTESEKFIQTSQNVRLTKEYPSHILEIIQNRLSSHLLNDRCHDHVMTLSMVMMAQAIRHSLFHLKKKPSVEAVKLNLKAVNNKKMQRRVSPTDSTLASNRGRISTKISKTTSKRLKKNPLTQYRRAMLAI